MATSPPATRALPRSIHLVLAAALAVCAFVAGTTQARAETSEEMGSLLHLDLNTIRYYDTAPAPTSADGVPGYSGGWSTWNGEFDTVQLGTYINGFKGLVECSDGTTGGPMGFLDYDTGHEAVSAYCASGDINAWAYCFWIGAPNMSHWITRLAYWQRFPSADGTPPPAEFTNLCTQLEAEQS